jgi:hypothetical protein
VSGYGQNELAIGGLNMASGKLQDGEVYSLRYSILANT